MAEETTSPHEALARVAELLTPFTTDITYPETDGEPMAETDTHRDQMTDALIHPLKEYFRDDPNVYLAQQTGQTDE